MTTFLLLLAVQCFFPIFDASPAEFTGVSLVNTDTEEREFTISITSPDGVSAGTGKLTVPAAGQRARLLGEIAGASPAPTRGWISVDAAAGSCTGFLSSGDGSSLRGSEPASSLGTSVLLPHIEVNTGFMELNHTDTSIAIVNPNSVATTVSATLYSLSGAIRGTVPLQLPARGSRTFRVSDAFSSVLPDNGVGGRTFEGYLRLTSETGIAAWQRVDTPLSSSMLRGRASTELNMTSMAMFPHFVFGGDYGSFLNLINPTSTTLNLELNAYSDSGSVIGETVQLTLAPGEARRSSVGEFFRVVIIQIFPPPTITGYIRIRESRGQSYQIAGDIEIVRNFQGAPYSSMMVWVSDAASLQWILPFSTNAPNYWLGYALVNSNELLAVQTDVTAEFVNSDGGVADRSTVSLSPRNRQASVVPRGTSGGYVRIRANLPIYALGSIGTRDGFTLDQLPALRQ